MKLATSTLPAVVLGGALAIGLAGSVAAQSTIPSDVDPSCAVPEKIFQGWFQDWSDPDDPRVMAADSVGFPTKNTLCDFYTWGAQMFLWLTSPEDDGLVLDGPTIFTVTPADHQGKRYLISNDDGRVLEFALRSRKFDDIGEIGQAGGGGVLMSQDGSLVYYGLHVNNVYGYFLTGQKTGPLAAAIRYPYNQDDLDELEKYMGEHYPDVELSSARALSMELKTSWVEAHTLDNPDDFIQVRAEVPNYVKAEHLTNNLVWLRRGTKTTMLALVGMHIVGTVQNHPEFVWATFEHMSNVPDVAYWYRNSDKELVQQPFSSDGDFLFMETGGTPDGANVECMKESYGNIVANMDKALKPVCEGGIVPSNTVRSNPWGSAPEKASADNNTLLLSNNLSVQSQLTARDADDVRANYIQVASIWTSAPSATAPAPIPQMEGFEDSDFRGSMLAANSTMETYHQNLDCFTCHSLEKGTPVSAPAFNLSHIYEDIVPLPSE